MIIEDVVADLHVHGFTSPETGLGDFLLKKSEPGERTAGSFMDYTRRKVGTKNAIIGVVNFDNTIYEILANSRERYYAATVYDDYKKVFFGLTNLEGWEIFVRAQEIPTNIGHVLVLGGDKNIKEKLFPDVWKAAKDMNALVIADHPLGTYGLGETNLRIYASLLDGAEAGNSNFPELTEATERLLSEKGLAHLTRYYNSDSHSLKTIFSSYNLFGRIDISNPATLLDGLGKPIGHKAGRNRAREKYIHAASIMYNLGRFAVGHRLRFVPRIRRQEIEIN